MSITQKRKMMRSLSKVRILCISVIFLNTCPESLLQRLFLTFSARKNFNDLTRIDESNGAMNILYGIRTICIFCIIVDHRFGTFVAAPLLNFDYVEKVSFFDMLPSSIIKFIAAIQIKTCALFISWRFIR
jgi:hypothetical protein